MYNPLLLGAVNDTEDLATCAMDFAPGVWLDPLLDSGNGFGTVVSESAFASANFDCSEFHILVRWNILQLVLRMSSVRRTRMFGTTLTIPSSAVCAIRMLLDA